MMIIVMILQLQPERHGFVKKVKSPDEMAS